MQRLIRLSLLLACCAMCGSPALAQFRDRDTNGFRNRDSSRFRGRDSRRFDDRRFDNRVGDRDRIGGRERNRYDTREHRHHAQYEYGKRAHIPNLASDLYEEANSICWEMHRHYRHNRDYKTTYNEMYQVRKAARHIAQLAKEDYYRSRHDDDHIERDLHEIDRWFHHIEGDVRNWRPDSRRAYRGGDLDRKMQELEETLHHLMADYGVKTRIDQAAHNHGNHPH